MWRERNGRRLSRCHGGGVPLPNSGCGFCSFVHDLIYLSMSHTHTLFLSFYLISHTQYIHITLSNMHTLTHHTHTHSLSLSLTYLFDTHTLTQTCTPSHPHTPTPSQYEGTRDDLLAIPERERVTDNLGRRLRTTHLRSVCGYRRGNHPHWTSTGWSKYILCVCVLCVCVCVCDVVCTCVCVFMKYCIQK